MKKFFKAAIATAMVCFSASLFAAAPSSFLKGTTYNLFEDEVVDNFAWGLEDITGLVLGGYDASAYAFNIGAGAWLGPLWYSVYDTGSFNANVTSAKEATADTVAKDGVNTDYVNITEDSYTNRVSGNNLYNNLYFSIGNGDWGVQSYWVLSDTTSSGHFGKDTHSEEDKADGTTSTRDTKISKYNGTNTFGANFKGIGTADPNDGDLYFQLNNFEVQWYNYTNNKVEKNTSKKNGETYYTSDLKSKDVTNRFYPSVTGEMGFGLPDLGGLSTKFVLTEKFDCNFTFLKPTRVTTNVSEGPTYKNTSKETVTYEWNYAGNKFHWTNALTPKFLFDFDVGDRLSLRASAAATVKVYNSPANTTNFYTTVTETTNYDKVTNLTSTTYQKRTQSNGTVYGKFNNTTDNRITESLIASINPKTDLAFVYQVKPEKFNLNFGAEWDIGSFTWTATTKKKATVKTDSNYKEETDEAGTKTVTIDTETYSRPETSGSGDGTTESKTTNFTATGSYFVGLRIGATWFITDAAQLDIAYSSTFSSGNLRIFNGGSGGLIGTALKLNFAIKF